MNQDFWVGVASVVIITIIHWLTSRKDPQCLGEKEHAFEKWRISGADAAQVKTCRNCGLSKKIPLDQLLFKRT